MITGISKREDPPFQAEGAEEVFLAHEPLMAIVTGVDNLLQQRGLELLYLVHDQVELILIDIVPLGADLAALKLPEGSVRESLTRTNP